MPTDVRELLSTVSPITFQEMGESGDGILIKGFVSVEIEDRSKDVVPPEEFKIDQFMAAPALLVNHKFWLDGDGNEVTVGKPVELIAAKLRSNSDKADVFNVVDIKTGAVVNTYPKSKVPNLRSGDKGLFIVAHVSEHGVIEKVKREELGAFSWKGLTKVEFRVNNNTNEVERVLTDIDLYEISLVNIPANVNATFTVGKSAYCVNLHKRRFENRGMAVAYLKQHNLSTDILREDEDSFYSRQVPSEDIQLGRLVVLKMADGVQVVAGPLKQDTSIYKEREANPSFVGKLQGMFADSSEKTILEQPIMSEAIGTSGTPESSSDDSSEKSEMSKEAQALEALGSNIAVKVQESLTPIFAAFTKAIETITTQLTEFAKSATDSDTSTSVEQETKEKTETVVEVEKTAASDILARLTEVLGTQKAKIDEQHDQLVEVAKSVQELASGTVAQVDRSERISGTAKSGDLNDCFDSLIPFLNESA